MSYLNIHPGEILAEEFLKPKGVSITDLARQLKVPRERLDAIVGGRQSICLDTGLRLSRFFGTSDRFWIDAQVTYDLERAHHQQAEIRREVQPIGAVA